MSGEAATFPVSRRHAGPSQSVYLPEGSNEPRRTLGSIAPRLFTPPLRTLTGRTTLGYEALRFWRDELHWTPQPHQRWLVLHLEELLPDGRPRFRSALITMGRRNGKTAFATAYSLWCLRRGRSVLFSSASLPTSRGTWEAVCEGAEDMGWTIKARGANSQEEVVYGRTKFQVLSNNRNAARGRGAPVVMVDELRAHESWDALAAIESCASTYDDGKILRFSNAGDHRAVPLAQLRALGIDGSEPSLFLAEWSAPEGCELDDLDGWRAANPSLGRPHGIAAETLRAAMATKPPAVFRVEELNSGVPSLSAAVDPRAWDACRDPASLDAHRSRIALCLDLSPDLRSAVLVAAATGTDGRTRVETVRVWEDTATIRAELPELVARIKPRSLGWYPAGPASALALDLKEVRRNVEITGADVTSACQSLAELVTAGRIAHNGDEVLTSHVIGAHKQPSGDGWRFSRREGYCNGAYAVAGAVHLARQLPAPQRLRLITA